MRSAVWLLKGTFAPLLATAAIASWGFDRPAQAEGICRVHGQVRTADGQPVAGVAVQFSEGLAPQVTDASGRFEVLAPADGARCTVTPKKANTAFAPAERKVWLSGDEAEASFAAAPIPKGKAKAGDNWWNAVELIVDGPTETGDIDPALDQDWFFFKVAVKGTYIVETWAGSLDDSYMTLYSSNLGAITRDDDSGQGAMSKISRALNPGTYYVMLEGYSWLDSGTYTIRVNTSAPTLSKLAINNGAAATTSTAVTLNHTCIGTPTECMASESPNFAGAAWQPYVAAPAFVLSTGNDTKIVYLKVRDAFARESNVVADSIYLNEPTPVPLTVNAPPATGYVWPALDEDWFYFTAAAADTYTIESWAGTLTDNFMALYQSDQTTLIASDDVSGEKGKMAKIVRALAPGTYYIKVRATKSSGVGTYLIRVMTSGAQVTILNPHGNPAATTSLAVGNAEVVFTSKLPGMLEVVCSFAVNAPAVPDLANKVRACISPVGASALQWQTLKKVASPWAGSAAGVPAGASATTGKAVLNTKTGRFEVKAVFTGLPTNNSDFGPKTLWAQVVDGAVVVASAQQPIEVFYPRLAVNNPGTGRNFGPNWFYYWKNGNVCGATTGWEYAPGWDYGYYMPSEDHINVENSAPTMNTGPETYTNDTGGAIVVSGQGIGPACCTETIAHEFQHKWFYDNWDALIAAAEADGENNGDDYDDPDDDGIPNIAEAGYLGVTTDPDDPDTYNMGADYSTYGDEEVRCRMKELNTGLTVAEGDDWAYPGSNSCPRYSGY